MKIRKILSICLLSSGLFFIPVTINAQDHTDNLMRLEQEIDKANKALSSMNNDMMQMSIGLDKSGARPVLVHETHMLKFEADGPEAKAIKAIDTKELEEQQLQGICSNPAMKEMIDVGILYKIVMKDKEGHELSVINLDLGKCNINISDY